MRADKLPYDSCESELRSIEVILSCLLRSEGQRRISGDFALEILRFAQDDIM
jgi:hypothetical protein